MQSVPYASFNSVNTDLIGIATIIMVISDIAIWRERYRLDVHLLGRNQAINLGIPYQKNTLWILAWIAILVATATAMVGPVSFFGLLICAIANHFAGTIRHSIRMPMVFLVGAILLVGGQTIFEHLLSLKAVLSVVVEFVGGLLFLYLIFRKRKV